MKENTYIFDYPEYFIMNKRNAYDRIRCNRPIIKNIRFIDDSEVGYHYIFDLANGDGLNIVAPCTHHIKNTDYFIKNTKKNLNLLKQIDRDKKKQIIAERNLDRFNYELQK